MSKPGVGFNPTGGTVQFVGCGRTIAPLMTSVDPWEGLDPYSGQPSADRLYHRYGNSRMDVATGRFCGEGGFYGPHDNTVGRPWLESIWRACVQGGQTSPLLDRPAECNGIATVREGLDVERSSLYHAVRAEFERLKRFDPHWQEPPTLPPVPPPVEPPAPPPVDPPTTPPPALALRVAVLEAAVDGQASDLRLLEATSGSHRSMIEAAQGMIGELRRDHEDLGRRVGALEDGQPAPPAPPPVDPPAPPAPPPPDPPGQVFRYTRSGLVARLTELMPSAAHRIDLPPHARGAKRVSITYSVVIPPAFELGGKRAQSHSCTRNGRGRTDRGGGVVGFFALTKATRGLFRAGDAWDPAVAPFSKVEFGLAVPAGREYYVRQTMNMDLNLLVVMDAAGVVIGSAAGFAPSPLAVQVKFLELIFGYPNEDNPDERLSIGWEFSDLLVEVS